MDMQTQGLGRPLPITSCFASIPIFSQAGSILFSTLVAKTAYIAPAVCVLKVRVLNACHHRHEQTFRASYSAEGGLQEKMPFVIEVVVMTEAGLS